MAPCGDSPVQELTWLLPGLTASRHMVGLETVQQRASSNICSRSMLLSASLKNSPRLIPGLFKSMSVTQSNFSTPSEAQSPVRKETVSTENKPNEKELWKQIPLTQGEDRADNYVQLNHLTYDRGELGCVDGEQNDVFRSVILGNLSKYTGRKMLKILDIKAVGERELPNGQAMKFLSLNFFASKINWKQTK